MTTTQMPDLPSAEEYEAAWKALSDVDEFTIDPLAYRVFAAINYEEPQEVTWEHVGALAVFAYDLRRRAEEFVALADKLSLVAADDLAMILSEGAQINIPHYDKLGLDNFDGSQRAASTLASAFANA